MNAGAIVMSIGISTDVTDDDVNGLQASLTILAIVLSGDSSGCEEGAANATGIGQRFKTGSNCTERATYVAGRIELAPFLEGGDVFGVEAFEAEVDVCDR